MDQAAFDRQVFTTILILTAAGGVLLSVLVLRGRRRTAAGAVIGMATALLLAALIPARTPWEGLGIIGLSLGIGGLAGSVLAQLAASLWKGNPLGLIPFTDTPASLSPMRWEAAAGRSPLPPRLIARRWFVAIAAGAGGIMGALVGTGTFWRALMDSLSAGSLVAAALLSVASVALIGPFEEYVLDKDEAGSGPGEGPERRLADVFAGKLGWRPWMRLGLVALLLLAVELSFNCVEHSIRAGLPNVMIRIAISGLAPAVASYYWSAALQYGMPRIAGRAAASSTAAATVLNYGMGVGLVYAMLPLSANSGNGLGQILLWLVGGALAACVIAFLTCGLFAFAGGVVLDRFHGWTAMALLGLALLGAALVEMAVSVAGAALLGAKVNYASAFSALGTVGGWTFGLVASGFPAIVKAAEPQRRVPRQ